MRIHRVCCMGLWLASSCVQHPRGVDGCSRRPLSSQSCCSCSCASLRSSLQDASRHVALLPSTHPVAVFLQCKAVPGAACALSMSACITGCNQGLGLVGLFLCRLSVVGPPLPGRLQLVSIEVQVSSKHAGHTNSAVAGHVCLPGLHLVAGDGSSLANTCVRSSVASGWPWWWPPYGLLLVRPQQPLVNAAGSAQAGVSLSAVLCVQGAHAT